MRQLSCRLLTDSASSVSTKALSTSRYSLPSPVRRARTVCRPSGGGGDHFHGGIPDARRITQAGIRAALPLELERDGVAGLCAAERRRHLERAAKDFLLAEVFVLVDLALRVDRFTDRDAGRRGGKAHALLIEVVALGGLPLDGDVLFVGGGRVLERVFGLQILVFADRQGLARRRAGRTDPKLKASRLLARTKHLDYIRRPAMLFDI